MLLTKSQALICSVLGPTRVDISPLAYAITLTAERLYVQKMPLRDFSICKDVYYDIAKKLMQNHTAAAKSVERLAKRFWDALSTQNCAEQYIGRLPKEPADARTLVIYLATYVYFDKPYYQMLMDSPELLFHKPTDNQNFF